jgi:hypothetical protein
MKRFLGEVGEPATTGHAYRCYFVRDGHIVAVEIIDRCTDDAAMAEGEDILSASTFAMVEIWDGRRKIGEIQRQAEAVNRPRPAAPTSGANHHE